MKLGDNLRATIRDAIVTELCEPKGFRLPSKIADDVLARLVQSIECPRCKGVGEVIVWTHNDHQDFVECPRCASRPEDDPREDR